MIGKRGKAQVQAVIRLLAWRVLGWVGGTVSDEVVKDYLCEEATSATRSQSCFGTKRSPKMYNVSVNRKEHVSINVKGQGS